MPLLVFAGTYDGIDKNQQFWYQQKGSYGTDKHVCEAG